MIADAYETVAAISGLSPPRAYARFRGVAAAAESFGHKPEVAELREHIRTALIAA